MALSFAWFSGLNFSIFTSGGPSSWHEGSKVLLETEGVHASAAILERCGVRDVTECRRSYH